MIVLRYLVARLELLTAFFLVLSFLSPSFPLKCSQKLGKGQKSPQQGSRSVLSLNTVQTRSQRVRRVNTPEPCWLGAARVLVGSSASPREDSHRTCNWPCNADLSLGRSSALGINSHYSKYCVIVRTSNARSLISLSFWRFE